jgi:hypothetical protein
LRSPRDQHHRHSTASIGAPAQSDGVAVVVKSRGTSGKDHPLPWQKYCHWPRSALDPGTHRWPEERPRSFSIPENTCTLFGAAQSVLQISG